MYKKSEKMRLIRQGLEAGNCLGIAIRNAGMKSYFTIFNWRKRKLIDNYFRACIDKMENHRINLVVDTLLKTALSGNVAAMCFYLKNKAGWKDSPFIDNSQHQHYVIYRPEPYDQYGKNKSLETKKIKRRSEIGRQKGWD